MIQYSRLVLQPRPSQAGREHAEGRVPCQEMRILAMVCVYFGDQESIRALNRGKYLKKSSLQRLKIQDSEKNLTDCRFW